MSRRPGTRQIARVAALALLAVMPAAKAAAQAESKPSPLTNVPAPAWTRVARLPDGRVFVTDENLAIDAAIAKVKDLPTETLTVANASWIQGILATPQPNEFANDDLALRKPATTDVYVAPSGMILNPKYIDFLRRTFPTGTLRFRTTGLLDPVVIVHNGASIGVLMPMKP